MIVWGGYDGSYLNTGGLYSLEPEAWFTTSTISTSALYARSLHTAIWTGSEMIVWGGRNDTAQMAAGRRYNPTINTWDSVVYTSGVTPFPRFTHTAIWTGSEMIIWGGMTDTGRVNTGGRYNPVTNTWIATSTISAPVARSLHTAIWTGSEMIVWGGGDGFSSLNTGGRYNPSTDSWVAISVVGTPSVRSGHTSIWTGSEMIVWGGNTGSTAINTGGRYTPP